MADETIKKILDDIDYDSEREDTLRGLVVSFFEKRALWMSIWVAAWGVGAALLTVWAAYMFFNSQETRDHIMYATIFTACLVILSISKIVSWQIAYHKSSRREMKRLVLLISELARSLDTGSRRG
jgi:hypothetical protein